MTTVKMISRFLQRITRFTVLAITVVALAVTTVVIVSPPEAAAQERRTLLQFLFGRPKPRQPIYDDVPVYQPRQQRQQSRPQKKRQKAVVTVTTEPPPPVIQKSENAKKVLVVGDFVAGSLADGLDTAFETTPGIVVESRSSGSSGLVREDYFNWQKTLPTYVAELKPDLIIISLGANDRQQMAIGDGMEKFKTETWLGEYTRRAASLASLAHSNGTPLLWVGMPAFQSTAMTADMVTFNTLFRTETEKVNGTFVDVWDGFVDEGGKFVMTGSDINGQQVRLRGSDGINLTKAGKRKLAFYVEKDIRKILGDAAASSSDIPGGDDLKDLIVSAPAANEDIIQTQPISLKDPDLDGGSALMDANAIPAGSGKSPRDLLVEKGEVAAAPEGRVDDFRLAKPGTVLSNPVIRN
ncbi:hypothetical protein QO002_003974 [Pararhizobium capsulatum DSM 1112]|uniref:SGNH hydrolase-type esterase domain-containing protein n=1 Tax=Pararhizobium capsulatum DSM 1112 TaxID=1121113 RepID=A0ABU0BUA2_9HYPH|nr:DUF459 domain-containing protein [Pararhizobium capsulatum]MDQ0321836.1 hypothetical protein [Pararhizobium capsulatum DSM 1112]